MSLLVINKLYYDNHFCGIRVFNTGNAKNLDIPRNQMDKHSYINATVLSGNRIRINTAIEGFSGRMNLPMQYNYMISKHIQQHGLPETVIHGTGTLLSGRIMPVRTRQDSDCGPGFYTGNNPMYSRTFALDGDYPALYTLKPDWHGLSYYVFTDDIAWALYIGVNQHYIFPLPGSRLEHLVSYVNSHDVVIGVVADDRIAVALVEFLNLGLTDVGLSHMLRFIDNGAEYVFKTQKACDALRIVDKHILTMEELAEAAHIKRKKIGNLVGQTMQLKAQYHDVGRQADECLQEWGGVRNGQKT